MTDQQIQPDQPTARSGSILAGYVEQAQFARDNRISARTIARYRNQADGLPSVMFGGKVLIPLREAGNWLEARIRRPNQRRRAG